MTLDLSANSILSSGMTLAVLNAYSETNWGCMAQARYLFLIHWTLVLPDFLPGLAKSNP
jgi:hypothetical protein